MIRTRHYRVTSRMATSVMDTKNEHHQASLFPLFTSEQVRLGEVEAARRGNVSLYTLMERAGLAVFQCWREHYPNATTATILCGKGNNGGDGYVVARLAEEAGLDVHLVHIGDPEALTGDAQTAKDRWIAAGGKITPCAGDEPVSATLLNGLSHSDIVIDALLGTGLSGEVRAPMNSAIEAINQSGLPVIAVDVPSGLCANRGGVLGVSVIAAHTVTFIGAKQGLVTGKARDYVGKLHFSGLGVEDVFNGIERPTALGFAHHQIPHWRLERKPSSHKGSHGRTLLLGGNDGMAGAIKLAAHAALRSGAGLVNVKAHQASVLPLQVGLPEAMSSAWLSEKAQSEHVLAQLAARSWVMGPGLGQDVWATSLFDDVMDTLFANPEGELPLVIDADGLNLLAQRRHRSKGSSERILDDSQTLASKYTNWVLTPHPGEAARLLGVSIAEIESDRYQAAKTLHDIYGGVVVLKGAGTVVYDGQQHYVCLAGNEGMATGGMGDVLSGVIGALLAQGYTLSRAALLGVLLHSHAADLAVEKDGKVGLMASDVIEHLRQAINGEAGDS